jgi:two-component system OmpR family sensor kinase
VLSAQREFVANASHQLRTPLTGLRLRLEAAALKTRDAEVERELAAAEREVERLARLLTALLTLANEGQRPPRPRSVPLAGAAERARERWYEQARRSGRALELSGEETACALASEEDLAIVLDNLIENALRYSPEGGDVTIEWRSEGAWVHLAVADQGPGIPAGEEEAVFERFRRGSSAKGRGEGTGLGLAIVRALAARWGGSAQVVNRPEGGARAEVRLPAGEPEEPLQPPNRELGELLPERL